MKRLILTTDDSGAGALKQTGCADIVIAFDFRFVWGPLPSDAQLAMPLTRDFIDHWLCKVYRKHFGEIERNEIGLIDLCERCDVIELWADPDPNAQLILIWLLDYLRPHRKAASKLTLVQAKRRIGDKSPENLAKSNPATIKIANDHLRLSEAAWQAYRAPNPRAWFDLLGGELGLLPQLRQAALELLEELPMPATGLGATEMRMLELISAGNVSPFDVFPGHSKRNKQRVFGYWEAGLLLDALAYCLAPAVSGLDERPFTEEMHRDRARHERYKQSRLSLTALGRAVLARTEDFSRHNPIHRWWGGTELTNDHLWRWDPANRALIAP